MSEQSNSAIASLDWSLWIECPNCKEEFDLVDIDDEHDIARRIFNHDWDALRDYEVTCPLCKHEFQVEKVEY